MKYPELPNSLPPNHTHFFFQNKNIDLSTECLPPLTFCFCPLRLFASALRQAFEGDVPQCIALTEFATHSAQSPARMVGTAQELTRVVRSAVYSKAASCSLFDGLSES